MSDRKQKSGAVELAYKSIGVFANDGKLDLQELNFLLGIALADGEIDDDEKRVLASIFKRVDEEQVSSAVWARIQEVRSKYGL